MVVPYGTVPLYTQLYFNPPPTPPPPNPTQPNNQLPPADTHKDKFGGLAPCRKNNNRKIILGEKLPERKVKKRNKEKRILHDFL
jgi:hypothetical protein